MTLKILEPHSQGDGPILVCDQDNNDVAEFFHNERHTVPQSYETALGLAKLLVDGVVEMERQLQAYKERVNLQVGMIEHRDAEIARLQATSSLTSKDAP